MILALLILVTAVFVTKPASAQSAKPKRGGILNSVLTGDPPGLLVHESATISNVWPMSPCYSNLVIFDPLKPLDSAETVIPELAERWSWQDNFRNLVLLPAEERDVARRQAVHRRATSSTPSTWSARRRTAPAKMRTSPRKDWYANVEAIETPEPHTVVFRLKRPQPSLLLMFASGYSPVFPAHVPVADLRQRCVGTGPFRQKEYLRGQLIELERNPSYFVPDRPYLDGIRYTIIRERGRASPRCRPAVEAFMPLEMTKAMADAAKAQAPSLVITEVGQNGSDNVILNHKRAAVRQPGGAPGRQPRARP